MKKKPPGWKAGETARRFADVAPESYDASARSADAVISMGSPVTRLYGIEKLRITPEAVDLTRMAKAGIPLLDSHNQRGIENHLGRFTETWFKGGALWGRLQFNDTERGRVAEGMVARGEIAGISAGYIVRDWEITDSEGTVLDPEKDRIRMDDDLTFTATRWELLEASLVTVPADASAMIRSLGSGEDRALSDVENLAPGHKPTTVRFVNGEGSCAVTLDQDGSVTINSRKVEIAVAAPSDDDKAKEARARMQARQRMIDRMRQV